MILRAPQFACLVEQKRLYCSNLMLTLFNLSIRPKVTALFALLSLIPMVASATVLMLDFGPTEATGASLTNSPYHAVNESFKDGHWNTIGLSNVSSGLVYSNGDVAAGTTLTLGSSVGSTLVDFSQTPANSSELGAAVDIHSDTNVFAGTSVGKDGIFTASPLGNNLVGIKVGGLPAGRYEIYVIGANTSNGLGHQSPTAFYVAATGDVSTFEIGGLQPSATSLLTPMAAQSWIEGASYAKITIDLSEGECLLLVADGVGRHGGGSEDRGFLNAVQIVAVPSH